ncbi:MAG TPA: hypothetical protein VL172_21455 [Kofleriaceae bacterium]|nr:hypothetical protein [Kofleriaceae bacterium]
MGARLLTTGSTIQCAHGATAILITGNGRVSAGQHVLLESDVHKVAGCTFMRGNQKSPCITIEWSAGATRATVGGTAPLTTSSQGSCKSAEGAMQGMALIADTQPRASAS